MIVAEFWLPRNQSVGHAAATIVSERDGYTTNISWGPTGDEIKNAMGHSTSDESEPNLPDRTITIFGLDDKAAAIWADNCKNDPRSKYNLGSTNCSWAVVSALKAGGSDKYFPMHQFHLTRNAKIKVDGKFLTRVVCNYFLHVLHLLNKKEERDYAIQRPFIDILDACTPVWSPQDAFQYCSVLQENLIGHQDGWKIQIPVQGGLLGPIWNYLMSSRAHGRA